MNTNINVKYAVSIAHEIDIESTYAANLRRTYEPDHAFIVSADVRLGNLRSALQTDKGAVAVRDLLSDVQHRCTARTISAEDLLLALGAVQRKLNITQKALNGTTVTVDLHAQSFPGAYKGIPDSTHFSAVFRSGAWHVTDIFRARCTDRAYTVNLTDAGKAAVLENAANLTL